MKMIYPLCGTEGYLSKLHKQWQLLADMITLASKEFVPVTRCVEFSNLCKNGYNYAESIQQSVDAWINQEKTITPSTGFGMGRSHSEM